MLDRLLVADLSGLTADERATMVSLTLSAESRLRAGVLDAIGSFDTADVAATTPYRTTKRWLEQRTRMSPGTAAHMARSARVLRDHLPATRHALGRGSISPQHTSAIVEVVRKVGIDHATTAEPILLPLAQQVEPSVVRRASAAIFARVDPEGAEKALHDAYDRRGVSLSISGLPGSERGYLDGVLDVESTELLLAALQPRMSTSGRDDPRTARQLRADALIDIAKLALDSGEEPELGSERPHLSVVIDEQALQSGIGTATLPWTGVAVPAGAVRRWACDAQLTPVLARLLPPPAVGKSRPSGPSAIQLGGGWLPMDVGRASRLATTGQVKALRVRDGGCVHPDCPRTPAYCDAHHVQHWIDGGPTSLDNQVLLCRHHHRTLHQGIWSLRPDAGQPGKFWATSAGWDRPAQTAADRSPVLTPAGHPPGPPPAMRRNGINDQPAWAGRPAPT